MPNVDVHDNRDSSVLGFIQYLISPHVNTVKLF
jgi:hypothetical protein